MYLPITFFIKNFSNFIKTKGFFNRSRSSWLFVSHTCKQTQLISNLVRHTGILYEFKTSSHRKTPKKRYLPFRSVRIEKYFVSGSKTSLRHRPRAVFDTSTKYFSIRIRQAVNNIYKFVLHITFGIF